MHTHHPQRLVIPTEHRMVFICEDCGYEYKDCLTFDDSIRKDKLIILRRSPHYNGLDNN